MRTTLRIAEDVLNAARELAGAEGKTIGEVVSELARRGLRPNTSFAEECGFPVFEVPPDAQPLTLRDVRRALEDDVE